MTPLTAGRVVAVHRKLHLFDIDIPGKMTFQESETLTAGEHVSVFDCGTCLRFCVAHSRLRPLRPGDLL